MGSTFGQRDKNATNDMMGGQSVATGTPGAMTVKDPNQGLDPNQVRNRKVMSIAGKGIRGLMTPAPDVNSSPGGAGGGFNFNTDPNMMPPTPAPLPPAPVNQPVRNLGGMQNNPNMQGPRKLPFFGY